MANILLVVPDSDLGKSLEFALGAEGHAVSRHDRLAERPIPVEYDCTILDHHAIDHDIRQGPTFFRVLWPVILLADSVSHPLAGLAFRTLFKPLLGVHLSAAIEDALAARDSA